MTTYPIEFHRRLEQKVAGRIQQILTVTGTAPPPRDPTNYDDKDEDERAKRTQPALAERPRIMSTRSSATKSWIPSLLWGPRP